MTAGEVACWGDVDCGRLGVQHWAALAEAAAAAAAEIVVDGTTGGTAADIGAG